MITTVFRLGGVDAEEAERFRYEEPDAEFIKSYPRTMADSMRRKDNKRKEQRDSHLAHVGR